MDVRPSKGSVGNAYDNAMAESFFGPLGCELLDRYSFRTPAEARQAVFRYIEGWYNPRRRHSSLGYLSPAKFEAEHWPESVRVAGLDESPAVAKHISAALGSTPLQAAEALLTPGREEEEIRLTQPQ
jgi:putative transposase